MITLIDLHQASLCSLPVGLVIELATVPAGGSVVVRDGRWLEIDDGEDCEITVSVGEE